jgi:hypothetical protein
MYLHRNKIRTSECLTNQLTIQPTSWQASSCILTFWWFSGVWILCRRFGTLCSIFIGDVLTLPMKWKRVFRNIDIKFRCWGITQRKNATFRTRRKFEIKKLIVLQLIEKYPEIYGTRTFITVFTTARHFSVSCVQWSYVYSRLISYTKHETENKCSSSEVLTAKFRNS